MKIENSSIHMQAQSYRSVAESSHERLSIRQIPGAQADQASHTETSAVAEGVAVRISQQSLEAVRAEIRNDRMQRQAAEMESLRLFMQFMMGRDVNFTSNPFSFDHAQDAALANLAQTQTGDQIIINLDTLKDTLNDVRPVDDSGYIQFVRTTTHQVAEHQEVNFALEGSVTTEDGRTLNIDFQLSLESSFVMESKVQEIRQMKDPLVIDFSNDGIGFANNTLDIDLDNDGIDDVVRALDGDSGMVVMDKNQDGRITDGTEIPGALSGDAFADLAALDEDGNGFIDAGDAAYYQLQVWIQGSGEDGHGQLYTLAEKGVGAIYVGSVEASFAMRDSAGEEEAKLRKLGIALTEGGGVQAVHQVDLATGSSPGGSAGTGSVGSSGGSGGSGGGSAA